MADKTEDAMYDHLGGPDGAGWIEIDRSVWATAYAVAYLEASMGMTVTAQAQRAQSAISAANEAVQARWLTRGHE